ncbi:hypothetical protein ACQKP0_16430 [Heyndrickxia sp. NPDC080065]
MSEKIKLEIEINTKIVKIPYKTLVANLFASIFNLSLQKSTLFF